MRQFGLALAKHVEQVNEPRYTLNLLANLDQLAVLYVFGGEEYFHKTLTEAVPIWRKDEERKAQILKSLFGVDAKRGTEDNSRN